ncbi:MAG: DUF6445 family protein [Parvularcula sp.]|jgi:hypothetical protein|nr:DUF6445 family protein [Parvularcula sp.]
MPEPSIRLEHVGQEHLPVLVADGLDDLTLPLRQAAEESGFAPNGPFYPGVRAKAPQGYAEEIIGRLGPDILRAFGWEGSSLQMIDGDFSLVTTPPEALVPFQRMPHVDGVDADVVAVLHYLCGEEHGGTSFYRHRSTGFEQLSTERYATYKAALERDVARRGLPPATYRDGSDDIFERTATYDCREGRILVYRGTSLHSGRIPEGHPLTADPAEGRLTVNSFLRRRPA